MHFGGGLSQLFIHAMASMYWDPSDRGSLISVAFNCYDRK
jgi:hypothetical protein